MNETIVERNIFNGMIFENIALSYIQAVYLDLNKQNEADITKVKNNTFLSGKAKKELIDNLKLKIENNKAAEKKYKNAMILSKTMIKNNKEIDMKSFLENMQYFISDFTKLLFDEVEDYREIRKENIVPALAVKTDTFEVGCIMVENQIYKIKM